MGDVGERRRLHVDRLRLQLLKEIVAIAGIGEERGPRDAAAADDDARPAADAEIGIGRAARRARRLRPAGRQRRRDLASDRQHGRVDSIVEHVLALGRAARSGHVVLADEESGRGAARERERRDRLAVDAGDAKAEARQVARRAARRRQRAVVVPVHLHRHRPRLGNEDVADVMGRIDPARDAAHDQPLDAEVVDQRLRRHRRVDHADAAQDDDDAVAAQRAGGEAVAVDRPGARAARLLDEDRRLLVERRDDADARRALAEAGARCSGGEARAEQQRDEREDSRDDGHRSSSGLPTQAKFMPAARRARPGRPAAAPSRCARGRARSRLRGAPSARRRSRDRRSPPAHCRARPRSSAASARSRCA